MTSFHSGGGGLLISEITKYFGTQVELIISINLIIQRILHLPIHIVLYNTLLLNYLQRVENRKNHSTCIDV